MKLWLGLTQLHQSGRQRHNDCVYYGSATFGHGLDSSEPQTGERKIRNYRRAMTSEAVALTDVGVLVTELR